MPENKFPGTIDDIIESVRVNAETVRADDNTVDAILADLGMGAKPQENAAPAPQAVPAKPQPAKEEVEESIPVQQPLQEEQPVVRETKPALEPEHEPEPEEELEEEPEVPAEDEKFNRFFNDHVAVIPDEKPKKQGFFARLFGGKAKPEEPDEEEEEIEENEQVLMPAEESAPEAEVQPAQAPAPLVVEDETPEPAEEPAPLPEEPQEEPDDPEPVTIAPPPSMQTSQPQEKGSMSNTAAFAPIRPEAAAPVPQATAELGSTAEIRLGAQTDSKTNTVDISDALGAFLAASQPNQPEEPASQLAPEPKQEDTDPAVTQSVTAQFAPQPGVQVGDVTDNTAILMPGVTADTITAAKPKPAPVVKQPVQENGDETGQIDIGLLNEEGQDDPTRELNDLPQEEAESEPEEDFETEAGSVHEGDVELETVGDVPQVKKQLESNVNKAMLSVVFCGVLGGIMLVMGTLSVVLPQAINPSVNPILFAGIQLILLVLVAGICYEGMLEGLSGLVGGRPSAYTLPALAAVACALQCVVVAAMPGNYDPNTDTLFAPIAALLLCAARVGSWMEARITKDNFAIVSSGKRHSAAMRLHNLDLTNLLAEGLSEAKPSLLVSRPAELVKGFVRKSGIRPRSLAKVSRAARLVAIVAVACAAVAMVRVKSISGAFGVLAAVLCLAAPACSTLHSAVCLQMQQRRSAKVGAVVPGWGAVEELGRVNTVVVEASDVFPAGSVMLQGIKTFEKERIDLAILYAASILAAGCDTLRPVFMNIVQNKEDMLFEVENLVNEKGRGFTGWVKGSRVIVGNRNMMTAHDIDIPSMDYENRYTRGESCPIYLAVSGKLFGMFVVRYRANRETASVIRTLQQKGFSMLVRSDDFNVTGRLIEKAYSLADGTVKVLTAYESDCLAEETGYVTESEGCMLHLGSFASFAGGMQAAAAAAAAQRSAVTVLLACIATGTLMGALLSLSGGLLALSLPAVVLYQLAWCVPVLVLPLTRRY